jgi:arylsulfatase A-like enzyme
MNFIIMIADTLRRDHLGCYGNKWIHTPNIDRLATQSVVFDHAFTGSFPTVPNRRDVLTGRYTFTYCDWSPMTPEEVVLPQVLGKAGYCTYMIVDTPHIIANGYGFDRGFSGWQWIRGQEGDRLKTDPIEVKLPSAPEKLRGGARTVTQYLRNVSDRQGEKDYFAPMTMTQAAKWLERNHQREKFLLYVDTFDPHEPWDPPKKYVDMYNPGYEGEEVTYPLYAPCSFLTDPELEHVRALYAGEVSMVDTWLGKLLKKVEDLGLLDDTAIIFTTDHGFFFGEHGLIGKITLIKREVNNIPLMMRVPGMTPGRRWHLVQPPDLMPTILDLAGVEHPDTIHGKSLVSVLGGDPTPVRDIAVTSFSIIHQPASEKPVHLTPQNWADFAWKLKPSTIVTEEWVLIVGAGDLEPELYHMPHDPRQQHNVFAENRGVAKELHAKYLEFLASVGTKEEYIKPRRKLPGV